jgi:hypothetical protein
MNRSPYIGATLSNKPYRVLATEGRFLSEKTKRNAECDVNAEIAIQIMHISCSLNHNIDHLNTAGAYIHSSQAPGLTVFM